MAQLIRTHRWHLTLPLPYPTHFTYRNMSLLIDPSPCRALSTVRYLSNSAANARQRKRQPPTRRVHPVQLLQGLTGHSGEALPPATLASSGGACGTSFTAAGSRAGRVAVDSALLAASVPRRVLGAELACGTCCAALVGGVLVLHVQARAALQGAVGGRRLTCRRSS